MSHHILAVCFDFGDTLVDEASEVKGEGGVSLRGDLIPGAAETLHELERRAYRLALVADGPTATYRNVLTQHGLSDLFEAFAISEELNTSKPDRRMFLHALDRLGIAKQDYPRTVMVGNRLDRDVKGANQVGMISVWLNWSPRYAKTPADPAEEPRFTIREPAELLRILSKLEKESRGDHSEQGASMG